MAGYNWKALWVTYCVTCDWWHPYPHPQSSHTHHAFLPLTFFFNSNVINHIIIYKSLNKLDRLYLKRFYLYSDTVACFSDWYTLFTFAATVNPSWFSIKYRIYPTIARRTARYVSSLLAYCSCTYWEEVMVRTGAITEPNLHVERKMKTVVLAIWSWSVY